MEQKNKAGSKFMKGLLITVSILFLVIMLVVPLLVVLTQAFRDGVSVFINAITDFYTWKALQLTLKATISAVVVNVIFGLFAAWAVTRFHFKGKRMLTTLIDVPFAVSPVIAGLVFILTFGRIGWAKGIVDFFDVSIVFATPGIVLATIFVTFPFISRELIPLLNSIGTDEEEAAALMGAKGFRIFFKITFPHIKWAFLYGIILCTARALGEFGAVSVVSGHLRGKTNTLPLQVEILQNEYHYTEAFAVSTILVILAVLILIGRNIIEHKGKKE